MRKKKNRSITSISVKFSTEFNPRGPKVSDETINKHRHVLQMDDTSKQLFPKKSIIVTNKRGRILQELLPRAKPYNIKNDLLDLIVHGYEKCD